MPRPDLHTSGDAIRSGLDFNDLSQAQADFLNCLLSGVLAAMPYFLEAFLTCLGGGGSSGDYTPGSRKRC